MNGMTTATSLIDIRDFLSEHRCAASPWEHPDRVVDRLIAELRERRHDEAFWADLRDLVERLEDRRFDATAFRGASALRGATVDRLLGELRISLGNGGPPPGGASGVRAWAKKSLGTTALFALLLLGVAVGCREGDDDDNAAQCDEAGLYGIPDDEQGVYCDLVDIIQSADISNATREQLLSCLPDLDAAYREYLLDLFQTMSDDQIASYLTNYDQEICANGGDDDTTDDDYTDDDH
jgi:hypothetical protein